MSNEKTRTGQVAYEFCRKFPDVPTRTLARAMAKGHPKLFMSVEHARTAIRRARGNQGNDSRTSSSDKTLYRPNGKAGVVTMPEPIAEVHVPFIVSGPAKIGILSDIHVPYHSPVLEIAIKQCKRHKCDVIILNGDTIDFTTISKYEDDPEKRSPAEEIRSVGQLLLWIRQQIPKARLIFKEGNHDERFSKFVWKNAPVLWQLQQIRLPNLLGWELAELTGNETTKLDRYGWEYITDKRMIMAGKLPILHGHEMRASSGGVNPARSAYLKASHTVLIGHLHKTSTHTESNIFHNECVTFSSGCLSSLHPGYQPYGTKWNHGFVLVDVANDGQFDLRNLRIADGKVRAS